MPLAAASLVFLLSSSFSPAFANSPKQAVVSSSSALSSHTDQLVQLVQVYLQNAGRWSPMPQGADMQLCQALQDFQKKVKTLRNDANGSFRTAQSDLQNLQFQSQVLEQLLNKQVSSPVVGTGWLQVRNDLLSISQSMTLPMGVMDADAYYEGRSISNGYVPNGYNPNGVAPNPFAGNMVPGAVVPGTVLPNGMPVGGVSPFGYNPTNINITENSTFDPRPSFQGNFNNFGSFQNGYGGFGGPGNYGNMPNNYGGMQNNFANNPHANMSNVSSSLASADEQSERFVKQLTKFLQMRGQWPPTGGTPAMVLCQNVQSFQQQLRKLNSDMRSNQSYAVLQTEMQQLGAVSQSIDQQLMQTGVTADVSGRWNEVRTSMNSAYQLFYSAGSNGYMWMR